PEQKSRWSSSLPPRKQILASRVYGCKEAEGHGFQPYFPETKFFMDRGDGRDRYATGGLRGRGAHHARKGRGHRRAGRRHGGRHYWLGGASPAGGRDDRHGARRGRRRLDRRSVAGAGKRRPGSGQPDPEQSAGARAPAPRYRRAAAPAGILTSRAR